jgi:hypothetical protein
MGIARSALELLCQLAKREKFGSYGASVLTLGRQSILVDRAGFESILKQYGLESEQSKKFNRNSPVNDSEIFSALGFKLLESIDYSDYESPTHRWDLNLPVERNFGTFNLVFDGGTSEHIFNIPQLLRNLHNLTAENGLILHAVPINNWVDHGFYQFSPTFLTDYYRANNWEVIANYVTEQKYEVNRPWTLYQYEPGGFDYISAGGGGGCLFGHWIIVRKNAGSTCGQTPQQTRYKKVWGQIVVSDIRDERVSLKAIAKIKKVLKRFPLARSIVMFFYVRLVLRNRKPSAFKI